MKIKQFEDKNLAHFSYAIESNGEIALIDPARNPQQYYDFAEEHKGKIIAVIETHAHADFVSSHLEIHKTIGATIYASSLANVQYEHNTFDDGDAIVLGKVALKAINTPGHSFDSISILLVDEKGLPNAVFTGDSLFVGDCGRPDLMDKKNIASETTNDLAGKMYDSLRKLSLLPDNIIVYPAHGAGSLCGKNLGEEKFSTIGNEKLYNWALQEMPEDVFIRKLLADQPFAPSYFLYNVQLNKQGAGAFKESIENVGKVVLKKENSITIDKSLWVIDSRDQQNYKKGHLPHSINIMDDNKFITWLGTIIFPVEKFYLVAQDEVALQRLIESAAAIGYESHIANGLILNEPGDIVESTLEDDFIINPGKYTIVDVRQPNEVRNKKPFDTSFNIPLDELREKTSLIPVDKPIVVYCAGGYRSAIGSSYLQSELRGIVPVYDLGESIKQHMPQAAA